jgi:hypothetical protein
MSVQPVIDIIGTQYWFNNELILHRENDLPAIITPNGTKFWYINGKRHRDNDLPAIIHSDGYQAWFINGERHRDNDLPAIIHLSGSKYWYINDQLHRLCAPAIINYNKDEYWYLNNKDITKEVLGFIKEYRLTHWSEWTNKDKILFRMRF